MCVLCECVCCVCVCVCVCVNVSDGMCGDEGSGGGGWEERGGGELRVRGEVIEGKVSR